MTPSPCRPMTMETARHVDVEAETTDEAGDAHSSVIDVTADGHDLEQVVNTMLSA